VIPCTLITSSYLAHARVLAESIAKHEDGKRLQVLIIDVADGTIDDSREAFDVVRPGDLPLTAREFHELAMCHEAPGLLAALKPIVLSALRAQHAPTPVVYLDPETRLYARAEELARICDEHPVVLVPRRTKAVPDDGQQPSEAELLLMGAWSPGCIGVSGGSEAFLNWWSERVRLTEPSAQSTALRADQRWLDLAPLYFDVQPLRHPGYDIAYWNADQRHLKWSGDGYRADETPLVLFNFSGFDPDRPYLLSTHAGALPRVRASEHPAIRRLCTDYAASLLTAGCPDAGAKDYAWAHLADGTPVSQEMRAAVRRALMHRDAGDACERPPDPFDRGSVADFVDWLAFPEPANNAAPSVPRLFYEIYRTRPDLGVAFPDLDWIDAERFRTWVSDHARREHGVPESVMEAAFAAGGWPGRVDAPRSDRARLGPGFVVAGYLDSDLGLGEAARLALRTMEAAGLPCGSWSFGLARTPRRRPDLSRPMRTDLNTNVVWINVDQLPHFVRAVGPAFFDGRYTVGSWVWETETPLDSTAEMSRLVDEIWTASEFCRRSIQSATDKPVQIFPHPVRPPEVNLQRSPSQLGIPEGFVFLFVFDFNSTLARKNPIGLIEAFCRAFEPGEGPSLVMKSINGWSMLQEQERLRYAIGDRPDILLVDARVSPSETAAMLARADCYVSLHRAEGFGLTMAEAMAVGTPVIATNYSGNLDFMSDDTAYLVPAARVRVGPGAGHYPADHVWGEPDLDVAAELMRRVYESPDEARQLGMAGQRAILDHHGHDRAARFLTDQFERIQNTIESGYRSDVADHVKAMMVESFVNRARAAGSVRRAGDARSR
jgi:glycosyltransferase involved in cell wall biosynthesis